MLRGRSDLAKMLACVVGDFAYAIVFQFWAKEPLLAATHDLSPFLNKLVLICAISPSLLLFGAAFIFYQRHSESRESVEGSGLK
jgi:hypothetical protein